MRRPLALKCLFVVFVVMVLAVWVGSTFDGDDDAPGLPDCQPAVLLTGQPFAFQVGFAGYFRSTLSSVIRETSTSYLEMHEKSPPGLYPTF